MDPSQTPGGPTFVRVVSVGRRMQDGWNRVDRGGPFKRFMAGLMVLLLAVPILVLAIFSLLAILALGLASALVTFVMGGRRPGPRRGSTSPAEKGRENVRVIPPR